MHRNSARSLDLEHFLLSMRTEEIAKAFADGLKRERERRGLSLHEISARTCVSLHYLEAIENGDFDKLPGDLWLDPAVARQDHYIRSFLRAYANEVGIGAVAVQLDQSQESADPENVAPGKVLLTVSESSEWSISAQAKGVRPPCFGEYLLYFLLTKAERVYLIGDLTEEYEQVLHKFGKRAATWWYYKQVLESIWPLLSRTLRKFALMALILPKTGKTLDSIVYISDRIVELVGRSKLLLFILMFLLFLMYELVHFFTMSSKNLTA
jgi:hypothetical protein